MTPELFWTAGVLFCLLLMIRVICLVGLKRRDNVAIMRRLTEEMYSVAER